MNSDGLAWSCRLCLRSFRLSLSRDGFLQARCLLVCYTMPSSTIARASLSLAPLVREHTGAVIDGQCAIAHRRPRTHILGQDGLRYGHEPVPDAAASARL